RLPNRSRHARADVYRLIIRGVCLKRQKVRLHYVADVNEIASLLSVFKYYGPLIIEQPGGEYRAHPCIWIRQRLSGAVYIEITKRDRGDSISAAHNQAKLLLVLLGYRINRSGKQRLIFTGWLRRELQFASRTFNFPSAGEQLLRWPEL